MRQENCVLCGPIFGGKILIGHQGRGEFQRLLQYPMGSKPVFLGGV